MKIAFSTKKKKNLTRRKYIKSQINIFKERKEILELRLRQTEETIKRLWEEFEKLKEEDKSND